MLMFGCHSNVNWRSTRPPLIIIMLAYLSKKISIPNDTLVSSLAWHSNDGYLAVGGNNGLLRVLKLEIQQQQGMSAILHVISCVSITCE
jgi:WD40 repeat protein